MKITSPIYIPCTTCGASYMQHCRDLVTGARTTEFHPTRQDDASH